MATTSQSEQVNGHEDHHLVVISENKRVSFGGDENVKMIVYDDGLSCTDHTLDGCGPHPLTKSTTAFTASDAPEVKVKVTSEDKEVPRPISPPAQLVEDARSATVIVSPLLPTFKKMESDNVENPFRPQQPLYHEVDDIVEAYRKRPFPPSPSHSPLPAHSHNAQDGSGANSTGASSQQHSTSHHHWFSRSKQSANPTADNDLQNHHQHHRDSEDSGSQQQQQKNKKSSSHLKRAMERDSSLSEARTDRHQPTLDSPLLQAGTGGSGRLPPPNKAEIVHVEEEEKRRRCGCCSIQ